MGHRLGLCESESLVIGICDRLRRSGQGQLRGKWAVGPASPELARATVGRN